MNPNNHIEQLIHDLCPSGVPYKTLGEVCDMRRGSTINAVSAGKGNIPVIAGGLKPAYYHDKSNRNGETITIAGSGAYAGYVAYWNQPIFVSDAFSIEPKIILQLNIKYLYYYLSNKQETIYRTKTKGGIPHVRPSSIDNFQIPLPPLPIQEEIVRILDTFTELITNIDTEIQKQQCELDLCRKQIFHQLNCKYEQLSSIFDMRGGYTPSTKNPEYWTDNTGYSWYTMDDIRKNGRKIGNSIRHITEKAVKGKGLFPKGTIVFATSATIGEHAILMKPALTNQRFTAIIPKKDDVYMMFYYHYAFIIDEWCLQHIKRGGFNSVDMDGFAKLPIPLPPLSEQRAIAEKLDTFEKLITNLKTERDLRQQQYEYYREKLINLLK